MSAPATIAPLEAQALLEGDGEMALVDIREAGHYGEGHALFAVSVPYSVLEARIGALVPRRSVPVLLIDAGDGIAPLAAARLSAIAYSDVRIVEGGAPGWAAAGMTVYKGVNVPSKVLGELVEAAWHPAMVTAPELAAWKADDRPMAFFDVRPPAEYRRFTVPGAQCLPNGELVHRVGAAAPADVPVVLTCAGRTRGIIGAVSLRLAGHRGVVHALENGTQGWALAGFEVARDNTPAPMPEPDAAARDVAFRRAETLCGAAGLPMATPAQAAAMLADTTRTSYLLDVRSAEEAASDPFPAAQHALSGQLVQASDQWVAVRRARLMLLDDTGLRAAVAGFWLKQMGFEPVVVRLDGVDAAPLRALPPAADTLPDAVSIDANEALGLAAAGEGMLIDLRPSMAYRAAHVAGAAWAIRPRLAAMADALGGRRALLVADDDAIAALAAHDLAVRGIDATIVAGGHAALVAAGAAVARTPDTPCDSEAIDYLFFVHDRHDGNLDAARGYLAWEIALLEQLSPAERAAFPLLAPTTFA